MLPGRKLAHLEGRRFARLNRYEWWTYLTAKEDWDYAPNRRQRWVDAWFWLRGDLTHTWGDVFDRGTPITWGEPIFWEELFN